MFYSTAAIEAFYGQIDVFLVAFARMAGFFVILPVFTGQYVPAMSRVMFSAFVAVLAVTTGHIAVPAYGQDAFSFGGLMGLEFLIGFSVGFVVYTLMATFMFMGQLVDYQIGFSMVSVFDPLTQLQVPITGNLYYMVMLVFFIQTGTLHGFIYEMARSYDVVPIGSPGLLANPQAVTYIINMIVELTITGVRISLPVVGTILVVDVILGVLVKAVPQMNVFVVGMPMKVLVGLVLLYVLAPFFGEVYSLIAGDMMQFTTNLIRGLAP